MSRERPPLLRLTDRASEQIKTLYAQRDPSPKGIRLGVKTKGCSGYQYTIEYADQINEFDEVIRDKGVTLIIDPKAVMFFIGCEMDFIQDKLSSGFTFQNPNEKGKCGCGESFHV